MLFSNDKVAHLSHTILNVLKQSPAIRLTGEEGHVLREIKRVITAELAQEEKLDQTVRAKLRSYSRPIVEGSAEWEVLYRKMVVEELRKQAKP